MDSMLKQRLVGTLVLVALGIVFWPLIFTQPDTRDPLVLGPRPEQPEIDRTPIAPPQSLRASVDPLLPDDSVQSEGEQAHADKTTFLEDSVIEDAAKSVPVLNESKQTLVRNSSSDMEPLIDAQGLPRFWVLQVATVSSETRADVLVTTLRERAYKAFATQFQKENQVLYRVQIGPNVDRQRLKKIKPDIDQALSVDSQILRYSQ